MSVDNLPGQSLVLRFRHLAVELRRADGHPNADREFERLLMRMTRALKDSFNERQLPVPILNALDADKSSGLNLFWEVQLAISVVGYWDPCVYTEPYEDYDDKTRYGGQRAVFLKPGPVSSVWPGVFEDILCHDGWCCDDIDLQAIFSMALTEQRFTIMGYYATACDLLAEWIENHADDDHGDQGGEPAVVVAADHAAAKSVLPPQYDSHVDLQMDEWIYKTKSKMTWPKLIKELADVGPERKWPIVTSEPQLRTRLKRYCDAFKIKYVPGERGNPVNKEKAKLKQRTAGKPQA